MSGPYVPKPSVPVLAHPRWNRGLVLSVPFATRDTTPRNLVNGVASTVTGTLGWSGGPWGPARDSATLAGSNYETYTLSQQVAWPTGPWTIEVWMTFRQFYPVGPNISGIVWTGDAGSMQMRLGDAGVANNRVQWCTGGSKINSNGTLTANVPCQLVMSLDGLSNLSGYINGALDSAAAGTTSGAAAGSILVAFVDDSLSRNPDGQMHALNVWGRALAASEIADRYRDLGGLWRTRRPTADYLAAVVASLSPHGRIPWHLFLRRSV